MTAPGRLGRPRSEVARAAALDAALRLVRRDGYEAVTIKGIAEAAGIGRQTVYRWWPTKADLLLEAVVEIADAHASPAPTGDAARDLRTFLRSTFALSGQVQPTLAGLMAQASHDPGFAERLQRRLLAVRRGHLRDILAAGQLAGQLGDGVPLELATDLVFGTMWYRGLSGHAPVDRLLADQLTAAVLRLLGSARKD